jgi:regulatory protein
MITRMVELKRKVGRCSIHLDGKFAFSCSLAVVARHRLEVGKELSDTEVARICASEVRQECFDAALRFLKRRLYSEFELTQRLDRRKFDREMVADVLGELRRLGYVDDVRFAAAKASDAAGYRRHGRNRAFMDVVKAGVEREIARRAVDEAFSAADSFAVARELAARRLPSLERLDRTTARRRLAGFLLRRGFEADVVIPVLDEALGDPQADDAAD